VVKRSIDIRHGIRVRGQWIHEINGATKKNFMTCNIVVIEEASIKGTGL
jgi:hypothetical protein